MLIAKTASSKTLTKSIVKMRHILKRRGPWPSKRLRAYHDQLLIEIAKSMPSDLRIMHS